MFIDEGWMEDSYDGPMKSIEHIIGIGKRSS